MRSGHRVDTYLLSVIHLYTSPAELILGYVNFHTGNQDPDTIYAGAPLLQFFLHYLKSTLLVLLTSQISSRIAKPSIYLVFCGTGMV
jgi:hypothetical protein